MNIQETINHHERIQELLDQRTRLLQDLDALNEEILEAMKDMIPDLEPKEQPQRALPPAGATGQSGSAPNSPSPKSSSPKSSSPKSSSPKSSSPKSSSPKSNRKRVLEYFQERPKEKLGSQAVIDGTGLESKAAQQAIGNLCTAGSLQRVQRGVYRLTP
jgi:hypothetical protein